MLSVSEPSPPNGREVACRGDGRGGPCDVDGGEGGRKARPEGRTGPRPHPPLHELELPDRTDAGRRGGDRCGSGRNAPPPAERQADAALPIRPTAGGVHSCWQGYPTSGAIGWPAGRISTAPSVWCRRRTGQVGTTGRNRSDGAAALHRTPGHGQSRLAGCRAVGTVMDRVGRLAPGPCGRNGVLPWWWGFGSSRPGGSSWRPGPCRRAGQIETG